MNMSHFYQDNKAKGKEKRNIAFHAHEDSSKIDDEEQSINKEEMNDAFVYSQRSLQKFLHVAVVYFTK